MRMDLLLKVSTNGTIDDDNYIYYYAHMGNPILYPLKNTSINQPITSYGGKISSWLSVGGTKIETLSNAKWLFINPPFFCYETTAKKVSFLFQNSQKVTNSKSLLWKCGFSACLGYRTIFFFGLFFKDFLRLQITEGKIWKSNWIFLNYFKPESRSAGGFPYLER